MGSTNFHNIKSHLTITGCQTVAEMVNDELKPMGISYFNYYKEDKDRKIVRLSNHQSWTEHYFKQQYIHRSSEKPKLYKDSNCFLWLTKDWPEMLTDAAINFDIAHGISIFLDQSDGEIEYISLATNTNNVSIHNFYINNLDMLTKFCLNFKDKASELIKDAHKTALVLPSENIATPGTLELSPRQNHCANLLLQGNSAKEIAKKLSLSYRTVEYYLQLMKTKLNCRNKSDLILKLSMLKAGKL